jgi:hypothetical protein
MDSLGAGNQTHIWAVIAGGSLSNLGHSLRLNVPYGQTSYIQFWDLVNGNSQTTIAFNGSNGVITVSSASQLLQTGPLQFPLNAWFWVEMLVGIATGTAGFVKVWCQGAQIINLTGVATQATGRPYVDTTAVSSNYSFAMDHHWWDQSGSYNNTALGDRAVFGWLPNAAGDSSGYTPNGLASNYLNAANAPPNTADYNASPTIGALDLYKGASGTGIVSVGAVQTSIIGLKDAAGTRSEATAIKSGGTVATGASTVLSVSAISQSDVWETDPSTSVPFVPGALTSLQWGGKVTA